jgi:hypothetical protein
LDIAHLADATCTTNTAADTPRLPRQRLLLGIVFAVRDYALLSSPSLLLPAEATRARDNDPIR